MKFLVTLFKCCGNTCG